MEAEEARFTGSSSGATELFSNFDDMGQLGAMRGGGDSGGTACERLRGGLRFWRSPHPLIVIPPLLLFL